jgi:hypothetical protein
MLQAVSDKTMAKAPQRLNWLKVIGDIPLFDRCAMDGSVYILFG